MIEVAVTLVPVLIVSIAWMWWEGRKDRWPPD